MFTEARAEISGPSEKHLKPGSVLRLTCRVVENIENPLYIFWYQNNHMINYDLIEEWMWALNQVCVQYKQPYKNANC